MKNLMFYAVLIFVKINVFSQEVSLSSLNTVTNDDLTSWIEYKPNRINNDYYNSSWIPANQDTRMGEIRQLSMLENMI